MGYAQKYKTPGPNPLQPDKFGNTNAVDHQGRHHYSSGVEKQNVYAEDLILPQENSADYDPDLRRIQRFENYTLHCTEPFLQWHISLPPDRDPTKCLPAELQGKFTSLDLLKRTILRSKGKME